MKSLAGDHDRRDLSAWETAERERSVPFTYRREREVSLDFPRAPPTGSQGLATGDLVSRLSAPALLAPARPDLSRQQCAARHGPAYPPDPWFFGWGLDPGGDGEVAASLGLSPVSVGH